MTNNLAAIARSSYYMTGNNVLRFHESYRPGKKNIVDITGWLPRVYIFFFVHEVMSILVYKNCICHPKKIIIIISRNIISVRDTSLVKYRVYNKMYTKTRLVIKGVHTNLFIRSLVKNTEKHVSLKS